VTRPAVPLVIAHRGASGTLPENTLAAYERAVLERADMIEIDLHRTRDGGIPITHDEDLAGLGGRGEIADATLAEVCALDAGGEPVPTLDAVLDRFGARIPFNLELKRGTREEYAGLEADALWAVVRRGLSAAARVGLLLSPRRPERPLERARALAAEALHPWKGMATPELVGAAHAEGLAVYVFTVDDEAEMRRFLDLGVDGLFTNHPARLRALVDARVPPSVPRGEEGP